MALARCEMHGRPVGQTSQYRQSAKPLGYPDSDLLCGRKQCVHIAVMWLDEDDVRGYAAGQRDFALVSTSENVRVQ